MIQTMLREIELRASASERIETIYFGGGTPSLLTTDELREILAAIHTNARVLAEAEITLEINPDDVDEEKLLAWKQAGINRLSIGVQSFDQEDLTWMNRAHTASQSITSIQLAQAAGFENISLDLIYGLPNMDLQRWEQQIEQALALQIQHISAYCLTVEKKTALHHLVRTKKIVPASSDLQNEHFMLLQKRLLAAGFEHYEISNFALPTYISKHNSSYWLGKNYLGIGPSAHSFDGNSRRWNISNNSLYIKNFGTEIPYFEVEELSNYDRFNELLLTGLRTKWGVSLAELASFVPLTPSFYKQVEKLQLEEKITVQQKRIVLTAVGKSWADAIASDLFVVEE
jgi:oxygen-independent coproporphyrinogen-3 oxidase